MGNLRFRPPLAPTGRSSKVDNGSTGRICPQGRSTAGAANSVALADYLRGRPVNVTAYNLTVATLARTPAPVDPRETEDCLFLDVIVPAKIYQKRSSHSSRNGAPVLVWIYGGGYTGGDKNQAGLYNPSGLLKVSQNAGNDGFVFVAINYRVCLPLFTI